MHLAFSFNGISRCIRSDNLPNWGDSYQFTRESCAIGNHIGTMELERVDHVCA